MNIHSYILAVFLFFCCIATNAQEAIVTTGNTSIKGTNGSISYSVGQVATSTFKSNSGTISQGVQQTYHIEVVSGNEDYPTIKLECSAYPNPTNDFLFVKIKNLPHSNLKYHLYSIAGQLIKQGEIQGNRTTIKMNEYISSMYLLKIMEGGTSLKTFKIVKR